jgi:mannose-1-phosphate guanylyltransferase
LFLFLFFICAILKTSVAKNSNFYPVILAGGRGTRFWPLSRKKRAKQLLALDGKQTMIQQTVARLLPLAPVKQFWIISNEDLRPAIRSNFRNCRRRRYWPSRWEEYSSGNRAGSVSVAAENP